MKATLDKALAAVGILIIVAAVGAGAWLATDWIVSALHLKAHHVSWVDIVLFCLGCGLYCYMVDLGKKIETLESTVRYQSVLMRRLQGYDE